MEVSLANSPVLLLQINAVVNNTGREQLLYTVVLNTSARKQCYLQGKSCWVLNIWKKDSDC